MPTASGCPCSVMTTTAAASAATGPTWAAVAGRETGPRDVPYVAGRPNYDASIAPEQWGGRLVWAMDVDPQGKVTHVEVEVAEGVGERLRGRAIAAGYLSLFPPDPGRATTPLRWRRSLDFAPR